MNGKLTEPDLFLAISGFDWILMKISLCTAFKIIGSVGNNDSNLRQLWRNTTISDFLLLACRLFRPFLPCKFPDLIAGNGESPH
jgi:hypothetical protein